MFDMTDLIALYALGGIIELHAIDRSFDYWPLIKCGYAEIHEDNLLITPLGTSLVVNFVGFME